VAVWWRDELRSGGGVVAKRQKIGGVAERHCGGVEWRCGEAVEWRSGGVARMWRS